ncbi:MAG: glycoside hydrolase family 25 protein [Clostridium sp.]|uniref:glycoside hydrolase family 25 protein n=1 Tax=Clostridium sp. TaxID=1506 RepID=UPI00290C8347|nr:glycoside hydrolase family 25 protein [Clostridium sp.]MDU7338619.1 glycoside hydrolase family 25 protein [Clostridium sp.]
MLKGIDVSNANGRADWDKLKSKINFAILRCGYGSDMVSQDDKQWARNVAECIRLGIPWGVYLYSYAMSTADAESEAAHALRLLKGLKPTYPVYIDMEDADAYKAKRGGISKQAATDICRIFCERISAAGFIAGVYANKDWAVNRLDMQQLSKWTFWLAQYNSKVTYAGNYDMWQYSSDGNLPGLSTRVDLNYCLKDFTSHNTQLPAVTGLTLDTSNKDMAAGDKYTVLAKCKDKPNVDTTGRDVIAVSEPYKDSKGRGWLIDVQSLPPEPIARHAHIKVTADGVTQQCNFNVL